jgi:hypothetical protein
MLKAVEESAPSQHPVLFAPQHHFVAVSESPQGVMDAEPSSACCFMHPISRVLMEEEE